jgi:hypothetical protein
VSIFCTYEISKLMVYRALQKQGLELQRQLAESSQREFEAIKVSLLQSTCQTWPGSTIPTVENTLGQNVRPDSSFTELQSRDQPTDLHSQYRKAKTGWQRQQRFIARFQTPSWLSHNRSAWEICCYQAQSGWDFMLRTYNVLHEDNPIWAFLHEGNVSEIRKLFVEGKASPFDRDGWGRTVLDVWHEFLLL